MVNIKFRAIEREDLEKLRDNRNDPILYVNFRQWKLLTEKDQENWYESLHQGQFPQTIMFAVDSHTEYRILIGCVGLTSIDYKNGNAEISIYVDARHQGNGHGKAILEFITNYAFEELRLHKVYAEIFAFNERSMAIFKTNGFVVSGKLTDNIWRNGKYHDSYILEKINVKI